MAPWFPVSVGVVGPSCDKVRAEPKGLPVAVGFCASTIVRSGLWSVMTFVFYHGDPKERGSQF